MDILQEKWKLATEHWWKRMHWYRCHTNGTIPSKICVTLSTFIVVDIAAKQMGTNFFAPIGLILMNKFRPYRHQLFTPEFLANSSTVSWYRHKLFSCKIFPPRTQNWQSLAIRIESNYLVTNLFSLSSIPTYLSAGVDYDRNKYRQNVMVTIISTKCRWISSANVTRVS